MDKKERMLNNLNKYLVELDTDENEGIKIKEYIEKYNMGETNSFEDGNEIKSDDLLDRAYCAETIEEQRRLAKKALKINPENLDAEVFLATLEDSPIKTIRKLENLRKNTEKKLEEEGFFDEDCIGAFWGMVETRPYMRLLSCIITALKDLGRYTDAIEECEKVIKLNESDNMGVRYDLCGMYCQMERFDDLEKLIDKYGEDSIYMLFPLALAQFKKGKYQESKKIIRKIHAKNKYVAECFALELDIDGFEQPDDSDELVAGSLRVGHSDEALSMILMNEILINTVAYFLEFYLETLKQVNAK